MQKIVCCTLVTVLAIFYPLSAVSQEGIRPEILSLMKEGCQVKTNTPASGEIIVTEVTFPRGVIPSMDSIRHIKLLNTVTKLTCFVSNGIMEEIASIPSVTHLELSACDYKDSITEGYFSLNSLNLLVQNEHLHTLKVHGGSSPNNLFLDSSVFTQLTNLSFLSLTDMNLRVKDLEAIAALPALESLELDVDFFQIPPQYYLKNSHLKYLTLHLRGFCFTAKDMKIFADLVNKASLSRLNLSFFQCDNDIPLEEITRIKSLREIEIRCGVFPRNIIEKLSKENRPLRLSIVEAVPAQQASLPNDCPQSNDSAQSDEECLDGCRSEKADVENLLTEARTWNSADGKFQTEARYISSTETRVTLEKKEGGQTMVDLEKLSAPDREYVRRRVVAEKRE